MDQHSYTGLDGVMKNPPEVSFESESNESDYNEDKTSEPVTPISEGGNVLYNTRALGRHETTYKLEKFEKNFMIIFNQENIVGYERRLGTEKDVASLCSTFSAFGFEYVVRPDCTRAQIMEELQICKYNI